MRYTRRQFGASPLAALPLARLAGSPASAPASLPPEWKARWIWYPEGRTLSGTFVMFRRVFTLGPAPASCTAWVTGHSRYQLYVNGQFLQRGPAACDPRYWDIDPVELTPYLKSGENVVAAVVCAFGNGDGTYVPPAAVGSGEGQGFLFQCDTLGLATDDSWKTLRPRCWKHGAPARWFLRALQEEFDARHEPCGWRNAEFDDSAWKPALVSRVPPGRPNLGELGPAGWLPDWRLTPREIPPLVERAVLPARAGAAGRIRWRIPPEEYFDCYTDGAFEEVLDAGVIKQPSASLFPLAVKTSGDDRSTVVTFEFDRELVGHPFLRVSAPEGAVIDVLWLEKQEPGKLLLRGRARFGQWLRVTCGKGVTSYEAFEYEALRLLQLNIRNARGPVEIHACGVKERNYAWANEPEYEVSDDRVRRAVDASFRTHRLLCQDTIVDNVTRERQQYAGDLEHSKRLSLCAFGETRQARRVIRTFAQGQNPEGWFMDSWPAWDRCQRLFQRHLGTTKWGAILDHALEFGIAVADYFLWTNDRAVLDELTPKLELYAAFLDRSARPDGLLPVDSWVWQCVWIDHIGFRGEADKHCALNLYWAGFLTHGLARLQSWRGAAGAAAASRAKAGRIVDAVRARYWSKADGIYVDNLPRAAADGVFRSHARTLAMSLLFDQIPARAERRSLDLLAAIPSESIADTHVFENGRIEVGFNYPLNEIWRLRALGRGGRADVIVRDLRERWAAVPSVSENGTYGEFWNLRPSSTGSVWCQANPVPALALYQEILGVRPVAPGFAEYEVRPQPGGLGQAAATVWSPKGPVRLECTELSPGYSLRWRSPRGAQAWLVTALGARVAGLQQPLRFEPGPAPGTQRAMMPVAQQEQEWTITVGAA